MENMEQKMIDFVNGVCPLCGGEQYGQEITETFYEGATQTVAIYCSNCEKAFVAEYRLQAVNPL